MKKQKIAIIGVSGYTGVELLRLLLEHPYAQISALVANSNAGKEVAEIYPQLANVNLPKIISIEELLEELNLKEIDVFFLCLPHATSQAIALKLPQDAKIIDLSADFRIKDVKNYEFWYKHKHLAPNLQKKAVYGLSEIYREKIKGANLIACPGCYPTSILIPLLPLIKAKLIDTKNIIADSKSGMTGAGRTAKEANLFSELNENFKPYSVKDGHRHLAEIEQELGLFANSPTNIVFTPYILPINRGILSTIYINSSYKFNHLKEFLTDFYKNDVFVKILPESQLPALRNVATTNNVEINILPAYNSDKIIIFSALDNLLKGASGQAVQNFNIINNLPEDTGLSKVSIFP